MLSHHFPKCLYTSGPALEVEDDEVSIPGTDQKLLFLPFKKPYEYWQSEQMQLADASRPVHDRTQHSASAALHPTSAAT